MISGAIWGVPICHDGAKKQTRGILVPRRSKVSNRYNHYLLTIIDA